MMVSYTRARSEGLGIENKAGLMQRPERVVLIAVSAITCSITSVIVGGNYKLYISGIPIYVFENMSVFTMPISVMAILTNFSAIKRLMAAKKALEKKWAAENEKEKHQMKKIDVISGQSFLTGK